MERFILLSMITMHLIDDYCLQGILASMKQKQWWKEKCPLEIYKHDYIVALIEHSFEWTFVMLLPLAMYYFILKNVWIGILPYLINTIIHAITDDLKANKHMINLFIDQLIHFDQIIITWTIITNIL